MPQPAEVVVVAGTRPEFVKLAPVVRRLEASGSFDVVLVHTGQHYDDGLSAALFRTLDLPEPTRELAVGSDTHARQTAAMVTGVATVIRDRGPQLVVGQGDTNSTLAAALAASKLPTAFAHVEAGLRSGDRTMPEETNRIVADSVADVLFAPTEDAASNLHPETAAEVHVVGNTVVDACLEHRETARRESGVLERLGLEAGRYVAATVHRPRNTDDPERLLTVLEALDGLDVPAVLPAHPRTAEAVTELGFEASGSLRLPDPLAYLDFLRLLDGAALAVTDSGGVQEEASILETPCLTVRPNTERPETIAAGVNELVEPRDLTGRIEDLLSDPEARAAMTGATGLYGDGTAAADIVTVLADHVA